MAQPRKEADDARLRGLLSPDALTVGLVSAFAGDRPLSAEEGRVICDLEERRKELFFTDLLYAVTHQFFAPAVARALWNDRALDEQTVCSGSTPRRCGCG